MVLRLKTGENFPVNFLPERWNQTTLRTNFSPKNQMVNDPTLAGGNCGVLNAVPSLTFVYA
jgi:hypothetical protein